MKKTCSKCGQIKDVKQFSKDKYSQDGYQYNCKECYRIYKKAYSQSDKGKQVRRRQNRSDKGKQSKKIYQHSEKGQKVRRRYAQSEKGQLANRKAEIVRRTRKTQAGGLYTSNQWYALCGFYDFRCLKCNKKFPFGKLTLDHIKPVSKGGSSFIWNLQPLCAKCNSSKKDKEIDYRKTLPSWLATRQK